MKICEAKNIPHSINIEQRITKQHIQRIKMLFLHIYNIICIYILAYIITQRARFAPYIPSSVRRRRCITRRHTYTDKYTTPRILSYVHTYIFQSIRARVHSLTHTHTHTVVAFPWFRVRLLALFERAILYQIIPFFFLSPTPLRLLLRFLLLFLCSPSVALLYANECVSRSNARASETKAEHAIFQLN